MQTQKYIFPVLLLIGTLSFGQQTPAKAQKEAFTITGATAHIGNGTVIENAVIIVENGKISACVDGTMARITYKGKIIDAKGKHVYPGFIAPNTTLGLAEIGAVRATRDYDEIGGLNPHIRSLIAYNAESKVVESMRPNGVLVGQITPRGDIISGTSSIVQFDAWNWEDAVIKINDGIHLNWPNPFKRYRGEDPGLKANKDYVKEVEVIKSFVTESKAYLNGNKTTKNIQFEAMQGLFNSTQKLFIHVNDEKGIIDAVEFTKANGINDVVIVGGYRAYKVAGLLIANNIPVIAQRVHKRPATDDDDYDLPYKIAKLLTEAGVLVGLESSGQMERMNTRNLPFYAGTVAAHGLDKEEALKLITWNTAKILGIEDRLGTLEVGKDATLFISEGDALDMRTNILTRAFINGRSISLESHQTELWKRYSNKYKKE